MQLVILISNTNHSELMDKDKKMIIVFCTMHTSMRHLIRNIYVPYLVFCFLLSFLQYGKSSMELTKYLCALLKPCYSPFVLLVMMFTCVTLKFDCWLSDNDERHSNNTVAYTKASGIKIPKIYWNLTRKAVLTMEWIDGIKLTDENSLREACLNRKKLIDEVVKRCMVPKFAAFPLQISYILVSHLVYASSPCLNPII